MNRSSQLYGTKYLPIVLFILISVIVVFNVFAASHTGTITVSRTANSETNCVSEQGIDTCQIKFYPSDVFAQNSSGDWVDAGDVIRITKNSDDLTFHYDGIKGYKSITFEVGVIHNGNYYSFATIKQMYPQITFSFPVTTTKTSKKYDLIISNIPAAVQPGLENITLTYKEHSGFALSQLKKSSNRRLATKIFSLTFYDLINAGFTTSINISERRVYIGNLTNNIFNNSLILDPEVQLNSTAGDGDVENTAYTVWDTSHDATSGNAFTGNTGCPVNIGVFHDPSGNFKMMRGLMPIDTSSIPDDATVTNASLHVYLTINNNNDNDGQDYIGIVMNTTQASTSSITGADFDQVGAVDNPILGGDFIDIGDMTGSAYNIWTLNATGISWINKTGVSRFGMREGHDIEDDPLTPVAGYGGNRILICTSETTGTSTDPFLNVTYTVPSDTFPTWSLNTTNSTLAGANILHSLKWVDDVALSNYTFSFDNGSGVFAVDSAVSMTGVLNWSNVTKGVNITVGATIRWQVNVTDSVGQTNSTPIFSYTTTAADSCTYGGSGAYIINMSHYCVFSTVLNVLGKITFIGQGNATFNAFFNATNIEFNSTNSIMYVGADINARIEG